MSKKKMSKAKNTDVCEGGGESEGVDRLEGCQKHSINTLFFFSAFFVSIFFCVDIFLFDVFHQTRTNTPNRYRPKAIVLNTCQLTNRADKNLEERV
jgi:hypothetical protein